MRAVLFVLFGWSLIFILLDFLGLCLPASAMHVGVMCIPLEGHLKPLRVVGEALTASGHYVTYFTESPQVCSKVMRNGGSTTECITVPSRGLFTSGDLFQRVSRADNFFSTIAIFLEESFRHHNLHLADYLAAAKKVHAKRPFDMIMRDVTTFVGDSVASALDVPRVVLFPFTTLMPLTLSSNLPLIGSGWPLVMNLWQRLQNYFMKSVLFAFHQSQDQLNHERAVYNITPFRDAFETAGWYDTVLLPTIWGFDIPQELCPNFHPLGLLISEENHTAPLEEDLTAFLNQCEKGVIYVNFGTLAIPVIDQLEKVAKSLKQLPYCIVWKMSDEHKQIIMNNHFEGIRGKAYIRSYFLSSQKLMNHERVIAFVSHCGDTSIHEALAAQLPIIGIPFFADQADVCQRIEEAGVGKCLGRKESFSSDDLVKAVQMVFENFSRIRKNIRRILKISKFLGGAKRAVDILETRHYGGFLGRNESFEKCVVFSDGLETEMKFLRGGQFDVLLLWLFMLVPLWLAVFHFLGIFFFFINSKFWRRQKVYGIKRKPRYTVKHRATQAEIHT